MGEWVPVLKMGINCTNFALYNRNNMLVPAHICPTFGPPPLLSGAAIGKIGLGLRSAYVSNLFGVKCALQTIL